MDKKIITIWADKNNSHDWLASASKFDCREKTGYTKVGFIGYNIVQDKNITTFDSDNGWGGVNHNRVLTINIDSIKDAY